MPAHDSKKPVLETWQRDLGEYGDHLAKLDVAMKAEVVQDMREVLSANRRNQQRVEDELMGGKIEGEEMGDINIDSPTNHHHHYPKPPADTGWTKAALGVGGVLAGVLAGALLFKGGQPQTGPADSNYKVLFFDKDGKPITIPQKP